MADDASAADEDLHLRYDLFCQLEAVIADIELEDLTHEEIVTLIALFDTMSRRRADQDRSNVLDHPSMWGRTRDGWAMFRHRVSCERERIGQLIGAEPERQLPSNVTAIGDHRHAATQRPS